MENQVVLFDGVCNLCNVSVQMLINLDKNDRLKFASLQSDYGQKILGEFDLNQEAFDSFVYYKNGQIHLRSTAAIEVFSDMGGFWKACKVLYVFPKFIRDGVYAFVSKNRYKWFGKKESCWLPTPELKRKFLD